MADEAKGAGAKKEDYHEIYDKEVAKAGPQPHQWHWSEYLFILLTICGIAFSIGNFTGAFEVPGIVVASMFCGSSAIGISLVWNLISIKRLAAATALLEKDVNRFENLNKEQTEMQARKKAQDEEMKAKLADMEKASMLLGASVKTLDDVQAQEEDMLKERMELLERRKALVVEMQKDMTDLNELALEAAKIELRERCVMYFLKADEDGDGMEVGSTEWNTLSDLLQDNGIPIDASAAGADGNLSEEEFNEFLDTTLDAHFFVLRQAVLDCLDIEEQIKTIKIERELK